MLGLIGATAFVISLAAVFLGSDQLLRIQYRDHHDLWEREGRTRGYFWQPKDAAGLSHLNLGSLVQHWLWRPPTWILANRRAQRVLFVVRFSLVVGMLGWLSALLAS